MGSAQLDLRPTDDPGLLDTAQPEPLSAAAQQSLAASALRAEAAERLAAHRQRREQARARTQMPSPAGTNAPEARPARRDHVAASVAERYANLPSFRAALADEARRAIEQAAAEAEIALRNAEAVTAAQQQLLAELIQYETPVAFTAKTAVLLRPETADASEIAPTAGLTNAGLTNAGLTNAGLTNAGLTNAGLTNAGLTNAGLTNAGLTNAGLTNAGLTNAGPLTVRLFEDAGRPVTSIASTRNQRTADLNDDEARALDAEIAFRQFPVFDDYASLLAAAKAALLEPPTPLPANLLEFPRQLVASRKARPRLAEGPLRDDSAQEAAPRAPQLRIFEVAPEQTPVASAPPQMAHEVTSIWLDALAAPVAQAEPLSTLPAYDVLPSLLPPQVAPMEQRLMATATDSALVLGALVAFTAAAAQVAHKLAGTILQAPALLPGITVAAATLTVFWFLYQFLFFTLSGQTPGMRLARIGLCTFTDENPSRKAMRRRLLAQAVALCPLGLGIVWALLDEDRLGWHDRISRMYQRAY